VYAKNPPQIDRPHDPCRRTIIFACSVRDDVAEVEEVVMPGDAMLWIGIGLAALLPLALLAALFLVNVGADRIALLVRQQRADHRRAG
jgi:hypothetical protein